MGQVEDIAVNARGEIDPDLLKKSLAHGERRGYLVRPAIEYISPEESIEYVFHNKSKGITLRSGTTIKKLKPNRGWTILVITDGSIYILMGDVGGKGKDTKDRIPLFSINRITSSEGIFKNKIKINTDDWTYSVPVQTDDDVAEAVAYVQGRMEGQIQSSSHETTWSVPVLYSVDPTTFESILAYLWELKGYSTKTTKGSGDKGIDVIATKDNEEILIQAKRYRPHENKVGIRQVQRAAGLLSDSEFNPTSVVLATTSEFTNQAIERASNIEGIRLMTGDDITAELREYGVQPSRFNIKQSQEHHLYVQNNVANEEAESTSEVDTDYLGSTSEGTGPIPEKSEEGIFVEGEHLAVTLTGIWYQDSTASFIDASKPAEGWILSFIIQNKGDVEWEWRGYDNLTIIDAGDFAYKPVQKLHTQDLPPGWQTRRINIQPGTRVRYLAYVEMPSDGTISKIRYAQKISAATNAYGGLMTAEIAPDEKLRRLHEEEVIDIPLDAELMEYIEGPPAGFPNE